MKISLRMACAAAANLVLFAACEQQYSITLSPQVATPANPSSSGPVIGLDMPAPSVPNAPSVPSVPAVSVSSTRTILITPGQTQTVTSERTAVKVVLIIDNSSSMKTKQEQLSAGIEKMFSKLKGTNADFYIYTTTLNVGHKPTVVAKSTYTYVDGSGKSVTTSVAPTNVEYTAETVYQLALPYNGGANLQIRSDMTDAAFRDVQAALQNAVLAVGTDGYNYESGLHSLAYILTDTGPNRIFQPGDKAAFFLIGDANDYLQAALRRSVSRFTKSTRIQETMDSAKADAGADYSVTTFQAEYYYDVPRVDRQTNQTVLERQGAYLTFDPTSLSGVSTACPAVTVAGVACPNALINLVKARIPSDGTYFSCSYKCQDWPTYRQQTAFNGKSLCSNSFTNSGVAYANIYDYWQKHGISYVLPNSCRLDAYYMNVDSVALADWKDYYLGEELKVGSGGKVDLGSLKTRMDALFGAGGYSVTAVFFDRQMQDQSCAGWVQEEGTRYRSFVTLLGAAATAQSVCSNDYSLALTQVSTFVQSVLQNIFTVALQPGEIVSRVFLVSRSSGAQRQVEAPRVAVLGSRLEFQPGVLTADDNILVEAKKP